MLEQTFSDDPWSARLRVRSLSELSALRSATDRLLGDAGISRRAIDDTVLVVSELATNAFQAAQSGTAVTVTVRVSEATPPITRRIEVDVSNVGEPVSGRVRVDPESMTTPAALQGRGLAISAQLGDVVLEGRIGGTHATFRSRTEADGRPDD